MVLGFLGAAAGIHRAQEALDGRADLGEGIQDFGGSSRGLRTLGLVRALLRTLGVFKGALDVSAFFGVQDFRLFRGVGGWGS